MQFCFVFILLIAGCMRFSVLCLCHYTGVGNWFERSVQRAAHLSNDLIGRMAVPPARDRGGCSGAVQIHSDTGVL